MIGLKSGNYLGKAEKMLRADGVIASITTYPDISYSESMHFHDTLHASLILAGGNLEKRNKGYIERLPGVVTFYDAGELHQSTSTLPVSVHVNIEIENFFLVKYELDICADIIRVLKSPDAMFSMLKIYNELNINDQHSKTSIHSIVLGLLQLAAHHKNKIAPSWISLVYQLMQDQWNENVSLAELSGAAGVHPVTVSKYFPQYFGCTIGEYARKIKIANSIKLISNTNLSLTAIGAQCGFADQSHFIRAFKQQTGLRPAQYKNLRNC